MHILSLHDALPIFEAPMHGLDTFIEVPVTDDLAERSQLLRLERRIHSAIGMIPVAQHPQTFEVRALQIDLLLRISAASSTEGRNVELAARAAMLLLHLQLDGQPVAVPTRDVR